MAKYLLWFVYNPAVYDTDTSQPLTHSGLNQSAQNLDWSPALDPHNTEAQHSQAGEGGGRQSAQDRACFPWRPRCSSVRTQWPQPICTGPHLFSRTTSLPQCVLSSPLNRRYITLQLPVSSQIPTRAPDIIMGMGSANESALLCNAFSHWPSPFPNPSLGPFH